MWLTINEPWVVSWLGYGLTAKAPGINSADVAVYKAAHTLIKSHAEAWHLYNDKYRDTQNGLFRNAILSIYIAHHRFTTEP